MDGSMSHTIGFQVPNDLVPDQFLIKIPGLVRATGPPSCEFKTGPESTHSLP